MQEHRPQGRSLFNLSRVNKQRRAHDEQKGEDKQFHDFLLTEQGKRWFASVIQREHDLRGNVLHNATSYGDALSIDLYMGFHAGYACHFLLSV